jgi:hypothetical protein
MMLLSAAMRDMLIAHLDGQPVPIIHSASVSGLSAKESQTRSITIAALISRGWIRFNNPNATTPRCTYLTEPGRHALAQVLAEYADALTRAGFYPKVPTDPTLIWAARLDREETRPAEPQLTP